MNHINISQHPFSYKPVLISSAATGYYAQPSELLSNIKCMHNHQHIYLTNRQIMKSSCTRQLPNLPVLDNDSNNPQKSPNVKKCSLVSLEKLRDDNYGAKLTKNQCAFYKDNIPIIIGLRHLKTRMHAMSLKRHVFRNYIKKRNR